MARFAHVAVVLLFVLIGLTQNGSAQTTELVYQGQLQNASAPASGSFDFEFALFDSGGVQIGQTLTRSGVAVANGIFSVNLDFGSSFPGATRLLEIRVRPSGGGAFTTLAPRQPVTSSPYSIKSLTAGAADSAASATNALQLGGVAANQYLQATGDGSGLTNLNASSISTGTLANGRLGVVPIANGGTGSATQNFVDLTSTQSAGGNKTFTGTLSGNVVNAVTQYNIAGSRVLAAVSSSTHVGLGAGETNTGNFNSFFGRFAGRFNTDGFGNSFFGANAGSNNAGGDRSTFVGSSAGLNNLASDNTFVGSNAGVSNTTGSDNSFVGSGSGNANTIGNENVFVGRIAGEGNTSGSSNTFVGLAAGSDNTTGFANVFVGNTAGSINGSGSRNTIIGGGAEVGSANLNFATALGASSRVTTSNTIQLGRALGEDTVKAAGPMTVGNLLSVTAGADVSPAGGGFIVAGLTNSINVAIDSNEIMARNNGATAPLLLNAQGGNVILVQTGTGSVGIGTSTPDQKLTVDGDASKTGGTSWAVFSDVRLKNIKGRFTPGLDAIRRLNPIRFKYRADNPLGIKNTSEQVGFSAQEVQKVLPEAVTTSTNGYLQMNSDPIFWTMLNAIKEQQSMIKAQGNMIEKLSKQVRNLQRRNVRQKASNRK
jgi:hypothetical protein